MYRNDGRDQDIAVDSQDLLRAQKASAKKRLMVLGIVGVVLVGAGVGGTLFLTSKAKKEIQVAHDRFATCLVGDLGNDKPSVHFRAAQLAMMSTPNDKRVDDVWPQRCASRAHAFNEALKNNSGSQQLADEVEKFAKLLATGPATTADLSPQIDKLFELAKNEKLTFKVASDVPAPPTTTAPPSLDTLAADARMFGTPLTLGSIYVPPFADTTFRFIVDDKDFTKGPAVCAIPPGAKEITCEKVPAPASDLSPGLRMWGTTDEGAKPYLFVGDHGKAGIYKSSGPRVVEKLEDGVYGASSRADGTLLYTTWSAKPTGTKLVIAKDGATKEVSVVDYKETGNPYYATNMFWDFVVYKSVKKPADGIRLMVRNIDASGALGAPTDIGRLGEIGYIAGGDREQPHILACRNGETTVLRTKGWSSTYLSFHSSQGWSPPVESAGLQGKMQCRSGEASIVSPHGYRVDSHFKGGVTTMRCTPSGCQEETLDIAKALGEQSEDIHPREAKEMKAAFVEGKLLVVWRAGERGGIRMRMSPIDRFAQAEETIVVDDHYRKGAYQPDSTIVGFEVLPLAKGAVLLLATVDGVSAFLVDENAKLSPLPTKL